MPKQSKTKNSGENPTQENPDLIQIREYLNLFKKVVSSATDAIGISTPDGRHWYQNTAFDELFGEIGEDPPASLYCDTIVGREVFDTIMEGGEWIGEVRMYGIDGNILDIFLRAYAFLDKDGEILGLVGVHTDFTERKQIENRLKREKKLSERIINSSIDGILAFDQNCNYTLWNPGMERISGIKKKEVIGKHAFDLFPFLKETGEDKYFFDALSGKTVTTDDRPYEIKDTSQKGYFKANYSPIFDGAGNIIGGLAIVHDITSQKEIELDLADSKRYLTDIIEFLPDPTWVIDNNHRVTAWNRQMEKLSGINKRDIIGKGEYAYAVPLYGHPRPVLIDLVIDPDAEWEKEYTSIQKEENLFIAGMSFHPSLGVDGLYLSSVAGRIYNAQGELVGAIESIRDITAIKRSEKERDKLIKELKEAFYKVQTLSGLLPICASCKKIRDDKGYWNQIESYIQKHSDAQFSHGMCPECTEKLYGKETWYIKGKNKK